MKHLQKHYPQYPFTEKRYVIYCRKGDDCLLVQIFAACYAAKHFINELLKGEKLKRECQYELWTHNGAYIRCTYLEEILDYKFTATEKGWQLPAQYLSAIEIFKQSKVKKTLVTTEDIAADIDVSLRAVHGALQALGVKEPVCGWSEKDAIKLAYKVRKQLKRGS